MSGFSPSCFRTARVGPAVLDRELEYRRDHTRHNFRIAMLGKKNCGRHTLSWRLNHMDNPNRPPGDLEGSRSVITVNLNGHRRLRVRGEAVIEVRFVPSGDDKQDVSFFSREGDIHRCKTLIFCVDIGDKTSAVDFREYMARYMRSRRVYHATPAIPVGNKRDLRQRPNALTNFGVVASMYPTRTSYIECSALNGDGMDQVMNTLLGVLFARSSCCIS